jgi:predicted RNA-binding Zn ribbon-like protein
VEKSASARTADGDAFRFRAGRLSLDFCSTLLWRHRAPSEQLQAAADLGRWFEAAGLRPAPTATREADLRTALALREAVYAMVHAHLEGKRFTTAQVAIVNAVAAHPTPTPRIGRNGEVSWAASEAAAACLACVARDAIELLTSPVAGRLRECAAPDCAFLFLDTSRPGTRRWCAMNRCGNRQLVREHRKRQRRAPKQHARSDDQRA